MSKQEPNRWFTPDELRKAYEKAAQYCAAITHEKYWSEKALADIIERHIAPVVKKVLDAAIEECVEEIKINKLRCPHKTSCHQSDIDNILALKG